MATTNCLGEKLAAEHLVDYTRQFINAYNRGDENESDQGIDFFGEGGVKNEMGNGD